MRIPLPVVFLLCLGAADPVRWFRVGESGQAVVDSFGIALAAPENSIAGALAERIEIRGDVVVVQAKVNDAPARGVTFALQDAASGESVGYWQNPLALSGENQVDAVLPLTARVKAGRLFAGTDRVASQAKLRDITCKPTMRRVSVRNSAYGSLVDDAHVPGQTFVATGSQLDAIRFRVRQLNNADGPDLCVKVFEWGKSGKTGDALAERVIPRRQFPRPSDGFETDFPVILNASVKRGNTYFVEWTAAGSCSAEQAYLLYAGDDGYPKGCRYENGNAVKDWDMYFETFESN